MTKILNLKRLKHCVLEFEIYLFFEYCNLVLGCLVLGHRHNYI